MQGIQNSTTKLETRIEFQLVMQGAITQPCRRWRQAHKWQALGLCFLCHRWIARSPNHHHHFLVCNVISIQLKRSLLIQSVQHFSIPAPRSSLCRHPWPRRHLVYWWNQRSNAIAGKFVDEDLLRAGEPNRNPDHNQCKCDCLALSLRAPQNGASASAQVPARPSEVPAPPCPPCSTQEVAPPLTSGERIQTNSWLAMARRILEVRRWHFWWRWLEGIWEFCLCGIIDSVGR